MRSDATFFIAHRPIPPPPPPEPYKMKPPNGGKHSSTSGPSIVHCAEEDKSPLSIKKHPEIAKKYGKV